MTEIKFRPKAQILIQLGDQLIKNEGIALLELIKIHTMLMLQNVR